MSAILSFHAIPDAVKDLVRTWIDLEAEMAAATFAGRSEEAQRCADVAVGVEREIEACGYRIRDLVCP